ncbi:MAG: hypothetical protein AAF975_00150 [Spirochaetota bacterium]
MRASILFIALWFTAFNLSSQVGLETESFSSLQEWSQKIESRMLYQDFRQALVFCLEAQREFPEEQIFRDYEASIREYLQAGSPPNPGSSSAAADHSTARKKGPPTAQDIRTAPAIRTEEPIPKLKLKERFVIAALQDPLLAAHGGIGFHQGSTIGGMKILNPFTEAKLGLYFGPSLGVNIFYHDSHWNLRLEHAPGSAIKSSLYSLTFGGSLRFRNKFKDLLGRSLLSFAFDVGVGLHDVFPLLLEDYSPKLILILGFGFSDRPFYHFLGIEALAGLQVDLGVSLYLGGDSPSLVERINWEFTVWQSLGIMRLGLSYRGSTSEFYGRQRVFFVQNQFAFLVGLDWRTNFQR